MRIEVAGEVAPSKRVLQGYFGVLCEVGPKWWSKGGRSAHFGGGTSTYCGYITNCSSMYTHQNNGGQVGPPRGGARACFFEVWASLGGLGAQPRLTLLPALVQPHTRPAPSAEMAESSGDCSPKVRARARAMSSAPLPINQQERKPVLRGAPCAPPSGRVAGPAAAVCAPPRLRVVAATPTPTRLVDTAALARPCAQTLLN